MSVLSDIEDGVRAWLVAAGASGGVPNAARAVIIADQDAVRPPLPYLTVKVILYDVQVGEDEDLVDDEATPRWSARGQRTGTVSVNAYGTTAAGWLERAKLMLRAPSTHTILTAAGLTIRPVGGTNNLSALLDDATEARFQQDFAVDYERVASVTELEEVVPLELVQHVDEFDDRSETILEVL